MLGRCGVLLMVAQATRGVGGLGESASKMRWETTSDNSDRSVGCPLRCSEHGGCVSDDWEETNGLLLTVGQST